MGIGMLRSGAQDSRPLSVQISVRWAVGATARQFISVALVPPTFCVDRGSSAGESTLWEERSRTHSSLPNRNYAPTTRRKKLQLVFQCSSITGVYYTLYVHGFTVRGARR